MSLLSERNRTGLVFVLCCTWIAAVSVHDAVLVVVYKEWIRELEQNPIGLWLLQQHSSAVWPFVVAKLGGTALVCTALVRLYQLRNEMALVVAAALSCFQLALLVYLHFK